MADARLDPGAFGQLYPTEGGLQEHVDAQHCLHGSHLPSRTPSMAVPRWPSRRPDGLLLHPMSRRRDTMTATLEDLARSVANHDSSVSQQLDQLARRLNELDAFVVRFDRGVAERLTRIDETLAAIQFKINRL